MSDQPLAGLLLAAGEGRRLGGPKALLVDGDGRNRAVATARMLLDGGCASVTVVLGAEAERAKRVIAAHLDPDTDRVHLVMAERWRNGPGASLRTGLESIRDRGDAGAVLVMLVDLPGVGAEVVARLAANASETALARASYDGRPGHPVVLGRHHWTPLLTELDPRHGANAYLRRHGAELIPCEDLGHDDDIDHPSDAVRLGMRHPEPESGS